ncbi:MAG TPA: SIMPL domain-containing protein [Gemmatimonadales bacterium]
MRIATLALLAAAIAPAAGAQTTPSSAKISAAVPTITTSGEGRVTLPPTRARVLVSVSSRGASAAAASSANDARVGRVLAALRGVAGVDSARVQRVHVAANENENRRIVDFQATAWIEAIARQLPRLGAVLDTALAAGASSVDMVQFEADSLDAARRRALGEAFRAAEQDARALAAATGRALGPLVAVSSAGNEPRPLAYMDVSMYSRNAGMGEAAANAVPAPQNIEVTARIMGQWQLASP